MKRVILVFLLIFIILVIVNYAGNIYSKKTGSLRYLVTKTCYGDSDCPDPGIECAGAVSVCEEGKCRGKCLGVELPFLKNASNK